MKKLHVNIPGREYDIFIENGILDSTGGIIKDIISPCKAAIVTDSNVNPLYGERLAHSLIKEGFSVCIIEIPAGEQSKCQEQLFEIYDRMLEFGITRTDVVIALGGGVVGDITGYAASSLLRGIPYIQIPTTLLAQVDSSVGGKVAIDLPRGKNLVGAFYQPKTVIIDPKCLNTLTDRVLSDGMAEVIKYGAIRDAELFETLEKIKNREELIAKSEEIIYNCCRIKSQVVENDEFDTGERMILNFGHTFGHGIEKQYNYETYTHGEAVAAGMVMACKFGERAGVTERKTTERMTEILKNFNLPTEIPISSDELKNAVKVDKKGDGNMLNLILIEEIGKVCIKKTDKAELT